METNTNFSKPGKKPYWPEIVKGFVKKLGPLRIQSLAASKTLKCNETPENPGDFLCLQIGGAELYILQSEDATLASF